MEKKNYEEMSNEQLLAEVKKEKTSKKYHAFGIGFLAGILIFGFGAWILSPEKRLGFLIPMAFPLFFIYKLLKNPRNTSELEKVLKEQGLI